MKSVFCRLGALAALLLASAHALCSEIPSYEFATGEAIEPFVLDVDAQASSKVAVKGLPSGIKFTAKPLAVRATKTAPATNYVANTIYGNPSKSGIYTATVTITAMDRTKTTQSLKFVVRRPGETKFDVVCDSSMGKAAGAGIYAAGKKVSLKATASKGNVFAGWYADEEFSMPLELDVDYRTASVQYVMPAEDTVLYARFVSVDEDGSISLGFDESYAYEDLLGRCPLAIPIESRSLPKVTVTGLPRGLRYNAKTLSVVADSGIAVPGKYTVIVKATNATVRNAQEQTFEIVVDNLHGADDFFLRSLGNGEGEVYSTFVGFDIGENSPDLVLNDSDLKLKVSGLPPGIGYDSSSGKLVGAPTNTGSYTVVLEVDGMISTIVIEVKPIPDWIFGSYAFNMKTGREDESTNYWWLTREQFSITSGGGVSGKGWGLDGVAKSWTGKLETIGADGNSVTLCHDVVGKDGSNYVLRITATREENVGDVEFTGIAGEIVRNDDTPSSVGGGGGIRESVSLEGGKVLWSSKKGTFMAPTLPSDCIFTNDMTTSANKAKVWYDNGRDFAYEGRLYVAFGDSGTALCEYVGPDGLSTVAWADQMALVNVRAYGEGGAGASASIDWKYETSWCFAARFAPADRAAFIAFFELDIVDDTPAPPADKVSVRLVEVSASDYTPYVKWAFGSALGFHWIHDIKGSGDDGYMEVGELTVGEDGVMSFSGSALSQIWRGQHNYKFSTMDPGELGFYGEAQYSMPSRKSGENAKMGAERISVGDVPAVVYTGNGSGTLEGGDSFASGFFGITSLWGMDIPYDLPAFPSDNCTARCELPLPDETVAMIGYSNVVAELTFRKDGEVNVWYFTPSGTQIGGGKVYVTADDYLEGKKERIVNTLSTRLAVYNRTESMWNAYLFIHGFAKGKVAGEENGAFFSAALGLGIPVGEDGLGNASEVEFSILDPAELADSAINARGDVLVYPVYKVE